MSKHSIGKLVSDIDNLINKIDVLSRKEYERTLEIYKDEHYKEEYKKLLFNGLIQHFSKVSLIHIKYSLKSVTYKLERDRVQEQQWANYFFTSDFFLRNTIYFTYTSINKIATLIKFRFTKPDKFLSAHLEQIHKQAKKSKEYKEHPVYKQITELIGNNSYRLISEARKQLDHSLDPGYYKNDINKIDFLFLNRKIYEIIKTIYNDHLSFNIRISDKDIDNYKVKTISPVSFESLRVKDIFSSFHKQDLKSKKLINVTNNLFDDFLPYLDALEQLNKEEKSMIKGFIAALSDLSFRINDASRTFRYFFLLYAVENIEDHLPIEIIQLLKDETYHYFMNIGLLRIYSIYDKLGLFLARIFSIHDNKTYFKNISEWLIKNVDKSPELINLIKTIVGSQEYIALDMLRQQFTHGIDMTVKQDEGTVVSDDYFLISMFRNINLLFDLIIHLASKFPMIVDSITEMSSSERNVFLKTVKEINNKENIYVTDYCKKHSSNN